MTLPRPNSSWCFHVPGRVAKQTASSLLNFDRLVLRDLEANDETLLFPPRAQFLTDPTRHANGSRAIGALLLDATGEPLFLHVACEAHDTSNWLRLFTAPLAQRVSGRRWHRSGDVAGHRRRVEQQRSLRLSPSTVIFAECAE
jgi:hypothetical protein